MKKPWLKSYKLGPYSVPASVTLFPDAPLFSFLDESAVRHPARPACFYLGRTITYDELKRLVDRLARGFCDLGIEPGDRVATILPTSPQFVICDYAIQKTGAVHVPCGLLHNEGDLVFALARSGAETVVCLDESAEMIRSIQPRTRLKIIITTSPEDLSARETTLSDRPGFRRLRDIIARSESRAPHPDINPKEDLALLNFTSRNDGRPKGVMLTHANLTANTLQSLPWIFNGLRQSIRGNMAFLIGIPACDPYGHWAIRASIHWGLQMIMVPDPGDLDAIQALLKRNRPFMVSLWAAQYKRLAERNIGRMNTTFISGRGPLPPGVSERIKSLTGMPITEVYGQAETGPLSHLNLSSLARLTGFMPFEKHGSIGVPVANTEARLIDPDTAREAPVGQAGRLYIKGPQVMKGYWPKPGSGLKEGWFDTGELCRMDEDGYFFLLDRNRNTLDVSGCTACPNASRVSEPEGSMAVIER